MKPLANAQIRRVSVKMIEGFLRGSIFANQAHVEVPVVRGAFRFAMPRRGGPSAGQIEQAVPMDSRRLSDQQFRHSAEAEILNLFRSESRSADFRNPNRQIAHSPD